MLAVLDTNHLRELISQTSALGVRLRDRLAASEMEVFTTIITVEESMQGWMAEVNRHPAGPRQVEGYLRLQQAVEVAVTLGILSFDQDAADMFVTLRAAFRRSGTMDLKIAAICLAHDATLLTRNVGDFGGMEGLRVENWLD